MKRVVLVALVLVTSAAAAIACSTFTADADPTVPDGGAESATAPDSARAPDSSPIADAGAPFCSNVDAQFCWSFDEGLQPLTAPYLTLGPIPPKLSDASESPPAAMAASLSGAGAAGLQLDVTPVVTKLRCEVAIFFEEITSAPSDSITVLQLDFAGSFFNAPRISGKKQDAATVRLTGYQGNGQPVDLGNVPLGKWVHLSLENEVDLDGGPWITRASVSENANGELAIDGGARDAGVHFDKVFFGLGALTQVTWRVRYDNVVCTWH